MFRSKKAEKIEQNIEQAEVSALFARENRLGGWGVKRSFREMWRIYE